MSNDTFEYEEHEVPERLSKLSRQELVDLTHEEKELLIDLVCAHNSWPLAPTPLPEKPKKKVFDKDETVYEIGHSSDLVFIRKADAEAVAELAAGMQRAKTRYDYKASERILVGPEQEDIDVRVRGVYSEMRWAEIAEEKAAQDKALEEWEKRKEEHDQQTTERSTAVQMVNYRIQAASEWMWKQGAMVSLFKRYLVVAEGDHSAAFRFLQNKEGTETPRDYLGLSIDFEKCVRELRERFQYNEGSSTSPPKVIDTLSEPAYETIDAEVDRLYPTPKE